eukprot:348713-Prymnesium_polylepis.1
MTLPKYSQKCGSGTGSWATGPVWTGAQIAPCVTITHCPSMSSSPRWSCYLLPHLAPTAVSLQSVTPIKKTGL